MRCQRVSLFLFSFSFILWSFSSRKVSILSSFESRLMQLENSIIPVHKQTENLQRLQENVDKTLSCMDHVISYYHVAKDTDRIIREGWAVNLSPFFCFYVTGVLCLTVRWTTSSTFRNGWWSIYINNCHVMIHILSSRPTGRLNEYLACIAKIQKAVEYFQDNNPDSPELNTVVEYQAST